MAICLECNKDMLTTAGCNPAEIMFKGGKTLPTIPYGKELRNGGMREAGDRCPDCSCLIGRHHHPGCDIEECPQCHLQLIGCGCLSTEARSV